MLILGHGSVDLAAGALFALLPFLVAERHYTLAAVGTFALVANVTNGACQPLFGARGDLREARWMLPLGPRARRRGHRRRRAHDAVPGDAARGGRLHGRRGRLSTRRAARLARGTAVGRIEAKMGLFSVGGGSATCWGR